MRVLTDEELERLSQIPLVVGYANSGTCGQDHPLYREVREYLAERERASERVAVGEDE